jgi:hypothetical protein
MIGIPWNTHSSASPCKDSSAYDLQIFESLTSEFNSFDYIILPDIPVVRYSETMNASASKVGRRGTIILPAKLRRRLGEIALLTVMVYTFARVSAVAGHERRGLLPAGQALVGALA